MWVKICANTNLEDAQLAVELGADAVGFVFAPSKRQVTAEQVAEITPKLPGGVERVGVFASDRAAEVAAIVRHAGLTAAQLHGGLNARLLRELTAEFEGGLRLVQTVAFEVDARNRQAADAAFQLALEAALLEPSVWAVLLDAKRGGASGGTGTAFDWARAAPLVNEAQAVARFKRGSDELPHLILAGGLRAENLAAAVQRLAPWGVDVATGVESVPGRKSPEKLRAFMIEAHGRMH